MTASLQFDQDKLPLVEAALRTSFRSEVPLRFGILSDVRAELKDEFRSLDELPQLEVPPGLNEVKVGFGVGQIPGAVLTGHKDGLRATIQQHVVVTRWVKERHHGAPNYPRYQSLRECHWRVVHALLKAVKTSDVPFGAVNMSYTNFLQRETTPEVLFSWFLSDAHVQLVKNAALLHKYEVSWQDRSGVDLRLQLERGVFQIGDERNEGYSLTTVAGKAAASLEAAQANLDLVHEQLQGFFLNLISDKAKKDWGYRGSSDL